MTSNKREQLLNTAERLFYEEGFHATGIDRIVAETGVVRMTLYNHFESKDALVAEILDRRQQRFMAHLDEVMRQSAPGGMTRALAAAHGAWLRDGNDRGCIMIKAMGEFAAHGPEIYDRAFEAKGELLSRIRDALAKDGLADRDGLAYRVFCVLEGSNGAAPVLGIDASLEAARRSVDELLTAAAGGGQ